MTRNHQMNYYDYAKTLSAEGIMDVINENPETSVTEEETVQEPGE